MTTIDPDTVRAAQLVERLRRASQALLPRLADAARLLVQAEGWKQHGYSSLRDFSRERLDHSDRWVRNLAHLGVALQRMPSLADAINGADAQRPLSRTAAFEISRVVQPDTLQTWVERAREHDIRALKELIHREQHTAETPLSSHGTPSVPARTRSITMKVASPGFLPEAFEQLERVHQATNPGAARQDFVEAIVAEQAMALGIALHDETGSPEAGHAHASARVPSTTSPTATMFMATDLDADELGKHREFLLALWAEQQARTFAAPPEPVADAPHRAAGEKRTDGIPTDQADRAAQDDQDVQAKQANQANQANQGVQAARDLLAAIDLGQLLQTRQDQLLLWIDNRNTWSLLGFADAGDFGRQVLGESSSTMRKRLRMARGVEASPSLRAAVDARRLSRERLFRIAGLIADKNLSEDDVRCWIAHASSITIKRLDDELRAQNRSPRPAPMHDHDWHASRRLAPGDARRTILGGGLAMLATRAPADVFLSLTLPEATAIGLRHGLNQTRVYLQQRAIAMPGLSSAQEARLFPSVRLARRYTAAHTPIPDWVCLLAMLEEFAEEHDNPRFMQRRPTDAIAIRDGWRCTAPGCTARQVEVHHIVYRSQGGSEDPSNRTSLCPFHHRMGEHGTLARVRGMAPLQLRWSLGRRAIRVEYLGERLSG